MREQRKYLDKQLQSVYCITIQTMQEGGNLETHKYDNSRSNYSMNGSTVEFTARGYNDGHQNKEL